MAEDLVLRHMGDVRQRLVDKCQTREAIDDPTCFAEHAALAPEAGGQVAILEFGQPAVRCDERVGSGLGAQAGIQREGDARREIGRGLGRCGQPEQASARANAIGLWRGGGIGLRARARGEEEREKGEEAEHRHTAGAAG